MCMKKEKKISIIVCAYNGEKYIDRCMNSIVNQTIGLESLEIILVNDASDDNTLDKFKQWEERYPQNIIVITYGENKGAGGARNVGLQYASGDYIGYIDCDDWIDSTMYEKLYEKVVIYSCDVVKCKCFRTSTENMQKLENMPREDKFYDSMELKGMYPFWENELEVGKNGYYGGLWCGIYKRTLLIENNIFFPEKLYYEDNFWGELLKLYIKKMYIIDEILYYYWINNNSVTMKRNNVRQLERLTIELLLLEELKKRGVYQKHEDIVERNFIIRFYINTMHILFERFDEVPDVFPIMKKIIIKNFPNYKKNKYLYENPLWCMLLKLLEFEPACTVEELEVVKEQYLYRK